MRINSAVYAALLVAAAGCKPAELPGGGSPGGATPANSQKLSKLLIKDTVVGKGDPVEKGDEIWVTYTGKLANGNVFDSNDKPDGQPFHLAVGDGQVIKGWDQGLLGMKVGGKRTLSIPYALAYGDRDQAKIPARSDLYFDVTLNSVLKKQDANVISANDVKVGTGRAAKKGDTVVIDYTAEANGAEFDNEKDVKLKIGGDDVAISGFDDALIGMQVGGERKITLPPSLTRGVRSDKIGMNVSYWDVKLKSIQ